jgi:transcriptional regulator with XRE-family HTH domain
LRTTFKERRKRLGLSQEELARRVGVSGPAIWAIENGVKTGRVSTWDRLEEILGVPQQILRRMDRPEEAKEV